MTFLGMELPDHECEKEIKKLMGIMTISAQVAKIPGEGNKRNKSRYVCFNNQANKIKLEIGSSVRPDPYAKRKIKTYIQEYLESKDFTEDTNKFELEAIELNVLILNEPLLIKLCPLSVILSVVRSIQKLGISTM